MIESFEKFPCLLLAGGLSRRMGGNAKFLEDLGGRSLLSRIIETLRPQVGDMVLNMNMALEEAVTPPLTILPDVVEGFAGPLAGVLTGLEYFNEQGATASHMLSVPTDAPFIPADLVERLASGLNDTDDKDTIVMAKSVGRVHPVVALWPLSLAGDLRTALVEEGLRKILVFADRYNRVEVEWRKDEGDPFFNINRPEDLEVARLKLGEQLT